MLGWAFGTVNALVSASELTQLLTLILLFIGWLIKGLRPPFGRLVFFFNWLWCGSLWCWCALTLLAKYSTGLFILGVVLAGVGVIPVALVASLFTGHWADVGNILLCTVFIIAGRLISFWWLNPRTDA
jgi:hypothetical protein